VRIVRSGPGCIYHPGQLLRIPNKRARYLIDQGFAIPQEAPYVCDWSPEDHQYFRDKHRPLVGDDVTSIVIPVYNQTRYTRQCIQSILDHTSSPYEIIAVDNGSDEETKGVLREFDINVVTLPENMGFPYAVNRGILSSRGQRICLLNTDTVVTDRWLEEMVNALGADAGMVGPTTNYSSGVQCVRSLQTQQEFALIQKGRGNDKSLSEIAEIGERFKLGAGAYRTVDELSGFCLLIDRRVISEIGGFDYKTFGLGTAEEKDFEDRAKRAGWKLVWAKGSYVHHFGHKTLVGVFKNLKQDHKSNHQKYLEKCRQRDRHEISLVVPMFEKTPLMFPTWDRLGYSHKALTNLLKVTDAEIVMYDDGSQDGTVEWIKSLDDPRIVGRVFKPERGGIDNQMDLFFSVTPGVTYLAKMDNDCITPPGWLEELERVIEVTDVDVVGPSHFRNIMAKKKYLNERKLKVINDVPVYYNVHIGGLFVMKRKWLDEALDRGHTAYWKNYGKTPGGWTHMQEMTPGIKAFYPKVFIELLDAGEGKDDYPKYNSCLVKERRIAYGRIPEEQ
jgi:GT2 family glycosyltransferase